MRTQPTKHDVIALRKTTGVITCCILFLVALLAALKPVQASTSAVIQNDSSYIDSIGYYHVVGEVLNTGDAWLQYARVTGVFKDAAGQVVDVDFTYTMLSYLEPKSKSPFDLIETDAIKSPPSKHTA